MLSNTDSPPKTVMLIDDNDDILSTMKLALEKHDFSVHGFNDPVAALTHVENGCKECGLAICDVSMPNMSGFQLARRMREQRPDMKIIFMTAFEVNKDEFSQVFPSTEIENVIRKPFTMARLVEIVKEAYPSSQN